jgi:hypothetical protein
MSAQPKPDLAEIKAAFENFRRTRTNNEKPRLPEQLWAAAVNLLEHYPFKVVVRELRLKPDYLRKRAAAAKGSAAPPVKKANFLAVTAHQLKAIKDNPDKDVTPHSAMAECRLVIERKDGSRLTLNLSADWPRIESLCANFLRG